MKTFILFIFLSIFFRINAQESVPTLSAGSGTVAFNKGTLDTELITKIIAEKQKEIVLEGIKRMIFKAIGNSQLDDYSQFYIERITEILFQEKNHKVMTKRILEESTNYLFVLGVTKLVLNSKNDEFIAILSNYNKAYFDEEISNINNLELRNKIIKTTLTICSEIPAVKELGLLNNFNYYELGNSSNNKVYSSEIVKEILNYKDIDVKNTYKKLERLKDSSIFKEVFEIKKKILNIENYKNDEKKAKKRKELNQKLNEATIALIKKIDEKEKIKLTGTNERKIFRLLLDNVNTKKENNEYIFKFIETLKINSKHYESFKTIKDFISKIIGKSSIIKDILNESGIDFKDGAFSKTLEDYKSIFKTYSTKDLIFDKKDASKEKNYYAYFFNQVSIYIDNIKQTSENLQNTLNNIDTLNSIINKIKQTDENVFIDINDVFVQNNDGNYKIKDSIKFNNLVESKLWSINSFIDNNNLITPQEYKNIIDLQKQYFENEEKYLEVNKNLFLFTSKLNNSEIPNYFKEKIKNSSNLKKESLLEDSKVFKQILGNFKSKNDSLVNSINSNLLEPIKKNYKFLRNYYKITKFYNEKIKINKNSIIENKKDNDPEKNSMDVILYNFLSENGSKNIGKEIVDSSTKCKFLILVNKLIKNLFRGSVS
ncbi:hypothetical protein JL193_01120 [Polaribacter batillariae]|uniref:Uncharacterized protein n=1 Tax=Polaribacter batillariae TaxID=2808900 RepID=A0ABX7SW98_9FLAO|nr:hypothetical protein [Polaribacter batillariae]QTD37939.1 hypothetical protein JL193_01120 [Polaribacter batillariae]